MQMVEQVEMVVQQQVEMVEMLEYILGPRIVNRITLATPNRLTSGLRRELHKLAGRRIEIATDVTCCRLQDMIRQHAVCFNADLLGDNSYWAMSAIAGGALPLLFQVSGVSESLPAGVDPYEGFSYWIDCDVEKLESNCCGLSLPYNVAKPDMQELADQLEAALHSPGDCAVGVANLRLFARGVEKAFRRFWRDRVLR